MILRLRPLSITPMNKQCKGHFATWLLTISLPGLAIAQFRAPAIISPIDANSAEFVQVDDWNMDGRPDLLFATEVVGATEPGTGPSLVSSVRAHWSSWADVCGAGKRSGVPGRRGVVMALRGRSQALARPNRPGGLIVMRLVRSRLVVEGHPFKDASA